MFRVKISKDTKLDLKKVSNHYGLISPDLKKRFQHNFNSTIDRLKVMPYFQIRYEVFRVRQVSNFPIMIHYIIDEEKNLVKILGVRFAQQDPATYPKI